MTALLETEGLTKRFEGVTAVDDVNLGVDEGTLKSIIGPNGAGKTTLFNLLSGGLEPTSGRVRLADEDITGLSPEEITRKGLARSFQITNIFEELSVLDNVRIAVQARERGGWNFLQHVEAKTEYRERASELLERVGLLEFQDTEAGTLSHGDKRALELALVLALDPLILLLDEPFAGMSQFEIEELRDLLDDVAAEYTIVLVEHNIDVVMSVSDAVAVLENGSIIADAAPDDIRDDPRVQRAYLGESR
ncbi:ABC transporter ATP-binding protein [Haloglomus litoreum]|uniref:ABC transporter ATP-binding protein n=1 Tax=Haloglomus litoreum TaxID=3034026 RepID=UPI0023E8E0D2|nr:ABC transporter ATP-binding protein [Haloglomus sp. DT116]